jgi:alkanesulfonate monooxygenase SsuD/methylene tetrahydromethanopterin reductase-like flavin-dependent oxidoreductase (luciferase family)
MRYGFVLPRGDAQTAADFAREAEAAGWDGFFVWEPIWGVDAWVSLTAAAMQTQHIRLGTMLSPLSRMRPWKLASESATLDRLSKGRVILSVGLGALDTGFEAFGEVTDRKMRAELLDEGLEILTGLWGGQPFNYSGKHYQIKETEFFPPQPPIQMPRIPIWVVGAWPRPKSMERAVKYDGLLPARMNEKGAFEKVTPADLRIMVAWIAKRRQLSTPFDIVVEGETHSDERENNHTLIQEWKEAGATWWIEAMWTQPDLDKVLQRIQKGPPEQA